MGVKGNINPLKLISLKKKCILIINDNMPNLELHSILENDNVNY